MEPQCKRTYQMMDKSEGKQEVIQASEYMNKVGEELQNILAYPEAPQVAHEDVIKDSLVKLGHDVSDIKWSLEKKKPKVSLMQISQKLDIIINMLRGPYEAPDCKYL